MGLFDRFRRRRSVPKAPITTKTPEEDVKVIAVGARQGTEEEHIQTFNNSSITFSSGLGDYDFDAILRTRRVEFL